MNSPLRWAGSKRFLLESLQGVAGKPTHFLDLFSGSASVAFGFAAANTWINDNCLPLQVFMEHLRRGIVPIVEFNNAEQDYYRARSEFNEIQRMIRDIGSLGGACEGHNSEFPAENWPICCRFSGLFYFLNKTSFNGLYRVNRKGIYNAPFGDTSYRPDIHEQLKLKNYPVLMHDWEITALDWHDALESLKARSDASEWVIYADPPYLDLYDGYSPQGFKWRQTAELLDALSQLPNLVLFSNSYHKPLIQGAKARGWLTYAVGNRTSISSSVETRGTRREVLFVKPKDVTDLRFITREYPEESDQ